MSASEAIQTFSVDKVRELFVSIANNSTDYKEVLKSFGLEDVVANFKLVEKTQKVQKPEVEYTISAPLAAVLKQVAHFAPLKFWLESVKLYITVKSKMTDPEDSKAFIPTGEFAELFLQDDLNGKLYFRNLKNLLKNHLIEFSNAPEQFLDKEMVESPEDEVPAKKRKVRSKK